MGLSPSEKEQLKELNRRANEPDEPPVGRSVNYIVDLKDKASVAIAKKLGFLPGDDEDESAADDDDKLNENPKGKGYFRD